MKQLLTDKEHFRNAKNFYIDNAFITEVEEIKGKRLQGGFTLANIEDYKVIEDIIKYFGLENYIHTMLDGQEIFIRMYIDDE